MSDDLRAALAKALHGYACLSGPVCHACTDDAGALLPVVERYANKRAAEVLRRFGDDFRNTGDAIAYEAYVRADSFLQGSP